MSFHKMDEFLKSVLSYIKFPFDRAEEVLGIFQRMLIP